MRQNEFTYKTVCAICGEVIRISWYVNSAVPYVCESCAWQWHETIVVHFWRSDDGVAHYWIDQKETDDDLST